MENAHDGTETMNTLPTYAADPELVKVQDYTPPAPGFKIPAPPADLEAPRAKRSKRTDAHRPGAIIPAEYAYVTSYHLATTDGGFPVPAFNVDLVLGMKERGDKFATTGALGKCSICGACFIYGDLWKHEPTGELIHVGQDCARKYQLLADRSAFELEADRRKAAAARECQKVANRERRAAFLAANAGLEPALECDHPIVQDIARKFQSYCELSPKQVALVLKLAGEASAPKPAEDVLVRAPVSTSRVTFRGVVVSAKIVEGQYGDSYKMTVKVAAPGGVWLAWGTCPAAMVDSAPVGERGRLHSLRGAEVEITAALDAGREVHFAMMKRPVGKVLKWSDKAAADLAKEKARDAERQAALAHEMTRPLFPHDGLAD